MFYQKPVQICKGFNFFNRFYNSDELLLIFLIGSVQLMFVNAFLCSNLLCQTLYFYGWPARILLIQNHCITCYQIADHFYYLLQFNIQSKVKELHYSADIESLSFNNQVSNSETKLCIFDYYIEEIAHSEEWWLKLNQHVLLSQQSIMLNPNKNISSKNNLKFSCCYIQSQTKNYIIQTSFNLQIQLSIINCLPYVFLFRQYFNLYFQFVLQFQLFVYNKMPQDFKELYNTKCLQFEQLSQQFNELQQQSTLIMNDLEDQIKQLKKKNDNLDREVKDLKEKKKYFASTVERQIYTIQKEKNQFKIKFKQFQKNVIQLEILNESLQNQLRATKSTLQQYENRTQKTMEQLAMLQIQLQQTTTTSKQQVARLKSQLKQTQDQLFALHHVKRKRSGEAILEQNRSQIQISQISQISQQPLCQKMNILNNKNLFKETLKDIRAYIDCLDERTYQFRNNLLK